METKKYEVKAALPSAGLKVWKGNDMARMFEQMKKWISDNIRDDETATWRAGYPAPQVAYSGTAVKVIGGIELRSIIL